MGLFDWLNRKTAAGPPRSVDAAAASHAKLDAYWATIGQVETDVLAPFIDPGLAGGPAWPGGRRAYRVVRRADSIIIATDGLSDPFRDGETHGNGFGIELFIETADIPAEFAGSSGDIAPLNRSWAFALLLQMAEMVAETGGFGAALDRLGVLSTEFPGVSNAPALAQLPRSRVTADDSVGLLIGEPAPDFPAIIHDMPLSPVRIVPLVLLQARELEAIRDGGGDARRSIASKLGVSRSRHRSDLTRPPVA